jgi:carbohydrate kinase (thermoresistant glucokinase family)
LERRAGVSNRAVGSRPVGNVGVRVVVMGVAASGKSSVAERLAEKLGARIVEADDHHLLESIAKMSTGTPLTDEDRWPWLLRLQRELAKGDSNDSVVVSCSALRKSYRDLLRRAGGVRFVFLDVEREEVERRIATRTGHFMGAAMVASQFAALERPDSEPDVQVVDATDDLDTIVERALDALSRPLAAGGPLPLLADGASDREISTGELRAHIESVAASALTGDRILLVPPDHTRLHSRAGEITAMLYELLVGRGGTVGVLPALGTHTEMSPDDVKLLFGDRVPYEAILHHRWRTGLVRLGEVGAAELSELTNGRFVDPIPVEVDEILLDGWDQVVSIGQVVPHEVIGMANFTKNIVIGLGGAPTVHRSHFVGAISDMETLMGRADGPVRHIVDAAFDRFIAPTVNVVWILTVMEDTATGVVHRGLFAGTGRSSESGGAAYRSAAILAQKCNVTIVDEPFTRVSCWLDPDEFRSTWLGNKAIYRTRMAIADGGELLVLAPGVRLFGEDPRIDVLIRDHGYLGTPATLGAVASHPDLTGSLGAAAHLIHGSSEGRFTITYCTDPASGGLSREEVQGVGFRWRLLSEVLAELGVDGSSPSGPLVDSNGVGFHHIANPALGLWATRSKFH